MPDEPIVGEEQEGERPRPRVVDRRFSARPAPESGGGPTSPEDGGSRGGAPSPEDGGSGGGAPSPEGDSATKSQSGARRQASEARSPEGTVPAGAAAEAEPTAGAPGDRVWTPEQEAEARAMAEEIARRPGLEWVVNSAVSLANIAATKLEMGAAADARIVIDALAGIIEEAGSQLGNVEAPLRQTLAELRIAYTERVTPPPATP